MISGGFKNVLGDALNIGYHLLSLRQALIKAIAKSALRLKICSNYEMIKVIRTGSV